MAHFIARKIINSPKFWFPEAPIHLSYIALLACFPLCGILQIYYQSIPYRKWHYIRHPTCIHAPSRVGKKFTYMSASLLQK